MDEIDFKCPEGAFYFILTLPLEDADDFTGWLLSEFEVDNETVMVCPAQECYATPGLGRNEVRISYCIDAEKLKRAMNILQLGIRAYLQKNTTDGSAVFCDKKTVVNN
jgi:aspartate aminotransferase